MENFEGLTEKKYYNLETMFRSLKDELTVFLKENNIYYELSGCGAGWHFEILADATEADSINAFVDSVSII